MKSFTIAILQKTRAYTCVTFVHLWIIKKALKIFKEFVPLYVNSNFLHQILFGNDFVFLGSSDSDSDSTPQVIKLTSNDTYMYGTYISNWWQIDFQTVPLLNPNCIIRWYVIMEINYMLYLCYLYRQSEVSKKGKMKKKVTLIGKNHHL